MGLRAVVSGFGSNGSMIKHSLSHVHKRTKIGNLFATEH
jgi:hypothetical protein